MYRYGQRHAYDMLITDTRYRDKCRKGHIGSANCVVTDGPFLKVVVAPPPEEWLGYGIGLPARISAGF